VAEPPLCHLDAFAVLNEQRGVVVPKVMECHLGAAPAGRQMDEKRVRRSGLLRTIDGAHQVPLGVRTRHPPGDQVIESPTAGRRCCGGATPSTTRRSSGSRGWRPGPDDDALRARRRRRTSPSRSGAWCPEGSGGGIGWLPMA
jgi:hypothetical protein